MTLPDLGGFSNEDRNAKADPYNLSKVTERYFKTKLQTTPNHGNDICTLFAIIMPIPNSALESKNPLISQIENFPSSRQ